MLSLLLIAIIIIIFMFIDIRSMKKAKLEKEVAPYIMLMLITGILGFLYYTNPHRQSISAMILEALKIKY